MPDDKPITKKPDPKPNIDSKPKPKTTTDIKPKVKATVKPATKAHPKLALTRVSHDNHDHSDVDNELLDEMDQLTRNIDDYLLRRISDTKTVS